MDNYPKDKYGRPRVFLEGDNIPIEELGIECIREKSAVSALPPVNYLHVWWARRPLTISRGAILGSVLPINYEREAFLELIGIPKGKNPIRGKRIIDDIKKGIRIQEKGNKYGYQRAFKNEIPNDSVKQMHKTIKAIWGDIPTVLDSFAGGGSIPFEASRIGFPAISNDLNPMAVIIEKATIEYPIVFKKSLINDIKYWGKIIAEKINQRLSEFFPSKNNEFTGPYIWVRTITCPTCELLIPLAPNFWLDNTNKLGYKINISSDNKCTFSIKKESESFDPSQGTLKRGTGKCPKCGTVIESGEISSIAKNGDLGFQLAVVCYRTHKKGKLQYREVEDIDLKGIEKAICSLEENRNEWELKGILPTEKIPIGNKTMEPINKGAIRWSDLFNPRQLLVHCMTQEIISSQDWDGIADRKKIEALRVYFQMVLGKSLNYNSIQSNWHPYRAVVANTFDRHDFAFKWSTGEFNGSNDLFDFTYKNVMKAYKELCELYEKIPINPGAVNFINNDASDLNIPDNSINCIVIDPPYYDNVMYAELSDFFYVWNKNGLKDFFPNFFNYELTNKESEAVANVSLFKSAGRGKGRSLAKKDYEAKMSSAFKESYRVLTPDGVMTVMFTHKKTEAWDTLSRSLMDSGFEITGSWPIHTESENSLHQAKKNAAASTILLVCRKRPESISPGWWEDLKPILEQKVLEKAEIFENNGIRRLDLSIACFGTALEIISEKWPVKRGDGTVISPDEALDAAREVVAQWFMDKITEGGKKEVDPATQFYILAWYVFQARVFPYDEARKLSISVGYSIDDLISRKILKKKGSNVELLTPKERARAGGIKPEKDHFTWDIDYVHGAIISYDTEGSKGLERFHINTGALERQSYRNAISYLLDVLPRTKEVMEYGSLNSMWEGNLQDKISRRKRTVQDPTSYEQMRIEDIGKEDEEESGED